MLRTNLYEKVTITKINHYPTKRRTDAEDSYRAAGTVQSGCLGWGTPSVIPRLNLCSNGKGRFWRVYFRAASLGSGVGLKYILPVRLNNNNNNNNN